MTNPASALDAVMDQAAASAQQLVPVPAVGNAPGLVPAPAANTNLLKPNMNDFMDGGGMDVDEYLKVKAEGFRIGDVMGLIEELEVEIDLAEVTPIYSFRCELGGQTKFVKSYDGVTTSDAKNFQAEVERLTRVGEKPSGIYQTAELPFTLLNDVADPKAKSNLTFDAGTRVGYTPSVTAFKPFQSFMKRLRASNPALLNTTIRVRISHEKRVKGSFEWGVVNFALIGG